MPSRRRTLAVAGGAIFGHAGALTLAGGLSSVRSASSANDRRAYAVDVSVFTTERLWRAPPGRESGPTYRARLAKAALERALPTLSDDRLSVAADVAIVEEPVPDDAVTPGDAHAVLDAFAEYVDGPGADAAATDSNLLIAHAPGADAAGAGQIPEADAAVESAAPVAAVFDGLGLGQNEMDATTTYRSGAYASALSTVVHEVGHNLGLGHEAGDARRDASDASRVFVTPMLTGHFRAADARPVYTPYFNPEIESGSLVLR